MPSLSTLSILLSTVLLCLSAQQVCDNDDFLIKHNNETLLTISHTNKSCVCSSFVGDGSALTGLQNNPTLETVAARYGQDTGQAFTAGTYTRVAYNIKEYDTHNAFDGNTFTCPKTGLYRIKAAVGATNADRNYIGFHVYKNGAVATMLAQESIVTSPQLIGGSVVLPAVVGDQFEVWCLFGSGQSLFKSSPHNYVEFLRVGNY